jgi:hypothetical protein
MFELNQRKRASRDWDEYSPNCFLEFDKFCIISPYMRMQAQ